MKKEKVVKILEGYIKRLEICEQECIEKSMRDSAQTYKIHQNAFKEAIRLIEGKE